MMKKNILFLFLLLSSCFKLYAQTHEVRGTVIDTTKATVIGGVVTLTSDKGDSVNTATDVNGKFVFAEVKGTKVAITVKSIGYESIRKRFVLDGPTPVANIGVIIMRTANTTLNEVKIVGVNPVQVKEDTVQYSIAALNLRPNATLEDALKKAPGIDVDPSTGAVTAQGQSVTKVRINGKDYMGGDVTSLTKNIPADLLESAQIIDDYGDQANLTGIKTGDPTKVLNINIRKDKNYGSSLQFTGGGGSDLLGKDQKNAGMDNQGRYQGNLNLYNFKGERQITVLGNLNNTNATLFNFGGGGGFPGGGGGGGGNNGGGGGGRGNAARGGGGNQQSAAGVSNQNGITTVRSIGLNFRDQWGKKVTAYGSYSLQDNDTYTTTLSKQTNNSPSLITQTTQNSIDNANNINHRFNFNVEWRPDTMNYFRFTPNFTYSKTVTRSTDDVLNQITNTSTQQVRTNTAYNSNTYANSSSPSYGLATQFFHKFNGRGRNMFIDLNLNSSKSEQSQNPIYNYLVGRPLAPVNQLVNTNSLTRSVGTNLSYNEPLGKTSFLEFNYSFNRSYTESDKRTDTLSTAGAYNFFPRLSNEYNFTFTTNRVGLNYRVIEKKYNYTLGLGVQPNTLDGRSVTTNTDTRVTTVNFAPQARFVYNFARSNSLNFSYNGTANQPSFNQLQPVIDFSNALYPVQGNPLLKPSFNNRFSLRYNKFSFETGNVFFSNIDFTTTSNNVSTNIITVPRSAALAASPTYRNLQNTILTTYVNTDGYYTARGFLAYSKPWSNRRYTAFANINGSYTNNVGLISSVDTITTALISERNVARTLNITPGVRFQLDLPNVTTIRVGTDYGINRTNNSINNPLLAVGTNIRTLRLNLDGSNYFGKWTLGYNFQRVVNYGYTIPVKNPNLLSSYVEKRFLKNDAGTFKASVIDIFNQNTGFNQTASAGVVTETNTNRLGRYFLVTFTYRFSKFAGRNTGQQQDGERRFRRDGGGERGPGGDRGGFGGPPGGGPPPGGPGND